MRLLLALLWVVHIDFGADSVPDVDVPFRILVVLGLSMFSSLLAQNCDLPFWQRRGLWRASLDKYDFILYLAIGRRRHEILLVKYCLRQRLLGSLSRVQSKGLAVVRLCQHRSQ